jgi:RNA polymerase sigma-70 factor (ECF subfamily)
MKSFLARAVVNIARRGESRGHRLAWWGRWFPPATTVDPDRFQGEDGPYPDHWKKFPQPWPAIPPSEELAVRLDAALAELPAPWRRVVVLRDVEGVSPEQVADEVGLTPEQQNDVLNRARELLRQALGRSLTGEGGP